MTTAKTAPQRHVFLVLANPLPGMEAEFNRWYDEQHLTDLLQLDGYVAAQRFRLSEHQHTPGPHPQQYLVIYELLTDNLDRCLQALQTALDDGSIAKTPSFDWQTMAAHVYTEIGPRLVASA